MTSSWPHPSFRGRYLPDTLSTSDTGFKAAWANHEFSQGFPKTWPVRATPQVLENKAVAVDLYEPMSAYDAFDFNGVTVNALVIGGPKRPALIRYFQTMVIRGPGAFTEVATDYHDFARAMRRKLLKELRPPLVIGDARR